MGFMQELYNAARKGSMFEVIAALDKGDDINWINPEVDEKFVIRYTLPPLPSSLHLYFLIL